VILQTHSLFPFPGFERFLLRLWSSRGTSIVALFLSYRQRPSCAREDTLPNGISWAAQLLTTALRTELGTTLVIGVVKRTTATTAYFRYMWLVPRMQASLCLAKFLSALPRPTAGPHASEAPTNERVGNG